MLHRYHEFASAATIAKIVALAIVASTLGTFAFRKTAIAAESSAAVERQLAALERATWQRTCSDESCNHFRASLVRRVGNYALLSWGEGDGGGESLFARVGGRWSLIAHAGGVMDAAVAISHGVPKNIATALFR